MVPTPQPRTLPLFDPHSLPQSWNERMADGEFAVVYSGNPIPQPLSPNDSHSSKPYCVVFPSLATVEDFAAQQVALYPRLRCCIYDFGWSSMVGSRMIPTGLVLLFIDVGILLNPAQRRRQEQKL
jgi:hypothetical protein